MGCRILNIAEGAILFCTTSMKSFGPVFTNDVEAENFMEWLGVDPRKLNDEMLDEAVARWRMETQS